MGRTLKLLGAFGVCALLMFSSLPGVQAASDLLSDNHQEPVPLSDGEPRITVGKIQAISPQEALGEARARGVAASVKCNQQKVIMSYPEARFTGLKKWCYDGRRVTQGTMDVKPYVEPDHRYTSSRDGWVYVPGALKKTDKFVTVSGVERGAHLSTRTGRFEYRVHGQAKPQSVYIPHLSRTGYGDGDCRGPKPKDLAPRLTAIYPVNTSKNVPRGHNIVAVLNMEAKEGTANESTFYVQNTRTGEYVEGATGRYGPDLSRILIVPYEPLDANTQYTATVAGGPNGVLGKTGDPLQTGKTWTFTTGTKI
jgi:hypothetical protein